MHGSRWWGRGEEEKYIYQKVYQHGQALQLLSVIMLNDLRVTVCVCSESSALFHITRCTSVNLSERVFLSLESISK